MTETILKYIQPVLLVVILIFVVFSSCNNDEKDFRRSILLEEKIDSLSSAVTAIDEKLLPVEQGIETSGKQIIQNKIKYDKQKKDITGRPADTVYNWTKQQLRNRTK